MREIRTLKRLESVREFGRTYFPDYVPAAGAAFHGEQERIRLNKRAGAAYGLSGVREADLFHAPRPSSFPCLRAVELYDFLRLQRGEERGFFGTHSVRTAV
jgi:hypothetical protein